ncbi:conserved hypothetical protein [Prochlorococcus marinus str. MIT 9202]|nr:conserved hypothetical protein [Prochlorococcus marinus str. MIT 9202]
MVDTVKLNYALIKKIKGFPTWEINGRLILGVLSLKELSNLTVFKN